MSHSSGYGVQVSASELGRRRAVDENRGRCGQLRRQALDAANAAVSAGARFIEVPDEPDINAGESEASARAAADAYERRVRRALEQVASARTKAVLAAFDQQVPPTISGTISIAWKHRVEPAQMAGRSATRVAVSPGQSEKEATDRVATMIASLAELLDTRRRDELAGAIIATIGKSDAGKRLDGIFTDVDQAYRNQANLQGIRSEAREIAATLRTYDTPATARAHEALAAATTRGELKSAADLARIAREEAEAREQEEFVVEQTAAVLKELGYNVGGTFVETAEHGEFAVATNDQLGDYGLQLRVIDGGKRVLTNTVALDARTTHAEDVAAEVHVCSDLTAIAERLGKRGVHLDRFFESKPGELPIERRLDIAAVRPQRSVRRTQQTSGAMENQA